MTTSLYNVSKLVGFTQARADDVNRELLKIKAAFDELQAAVIAGLDPNRAPVTLYTWRAYANSADGTIDFTTGEPDDHTYIGFAFNRLIQTPSNNPQDYEWSPIAGALGNFTAFDTLNVAGRPAVNVLGDLSLNAEQLLAYQFDRQTLRDYVDARLYVDGQPVNTVIVTERNERQTANTALAETIALIGAKAPSGASFILDLNKTFVSPTLSLGARLSAIQSEAQGATASVQNLQQAIATANYASATDLSLIGAKTLDGSAFVLNLSTVKVTGGQTLSQYINTAVAAAAGGAASVSQIYDAVIAPNGTAYAKAVLQLDANGKVVGYSATNNGSTGAIRFRFDSFVIENPQGGSLFVAEGNTVRMPNVVVDTITVNALTPIFSNPSVQNLDPNGWIQKLPGGLIIQGGKQRMAITSETVFSVNYPEAFPNQVLTVVAIPFITTASVLRDLWMQLVGEPTKSRATFMTQSSTSNSQRIDGFDWIAFGR